MDKIIFAYRLSVDTGFAPCVDNNILTLSCCKGGQKRNGKFINTGLRYRIGEYHNKHPDDEMYLMGIYKNRLLYYAKINDVMPMEKYYSTDMKKIYGKRKDHVFDFNENDCKLERNNYLPKIHPKYDDQVERDKAGKYVIISGKNQFSYWGKSAQPIDTNMLDKLPKKQEKKEYIEDEFLKLHEYILKNFNITQGNCAPPHDPIEDADCRGCNQK